MWSMPDNWSELTTALIEADKAVGQAQIRLREAESIVVSRSRDLHDAIATQVKARNAVREALQTRTS